MHHDNNTLSMRLAAKSADYNKYSEFIKTDYTAKSKDHEISSWFGSYESDFSKKVSSHLESKKLRQKKKLGQSAQSIVLDTSDEQVWTGALYMGLTSVMDVIYDTGSDWLIIEGSDCLSC